MQIDMSKIRVIYDPPPIPDRRFDWRAGHDDLDASTADDYRPPQGFGATEEEALQDLIERLQELHP